MPKVAKNKAKSQRGSKNMVFTYHVPSDDPQYREELLAMLAKHMAIAYAFQLEAAPTTGQLHYQGAVRWPIQLRFTTLQEHSGLSLKLWVQTAKASDPLRYCTKDYTHVAGPWLHNYEIEPPLVSRMTMLEDLPWQAKVREVLATPCDPHDRKFWWFYDLIGGRGKSSFVHDLLTKTKRVLVITKAAPSDVFHSIAKYITPERGEPRTTFHLIVDFPKGVHGMPVGMWEVLETIKNGYFFSSKYSSGTIVFNVPHIIIFANFEPDRLEDIVADRLESSVFDINDFTADT